MPERIRLSRAKGWRKPPGVIVVARPTKWGNPFVVGRDGTAADCVHRYTVLLGGYLCITSKPSVDDQRAALKHAKDQISTLKGHDLACWCQLGKPCHADVLLEVANSDDPDVSRFLIKGGPDG